MKLYAVMAMWGSRERVVRSALPLITLDLKQAIQTALNIHTLGFPFDLEGDQVAVYRLEAGAPFPAQVFHLAKERTDAFQPVIFWRCKDAALEWVDEWNDEAERQRYLALRTAA